jgi:hypothetical protein
MIKVSTIEYLNQINGVYIDLEKYNRNKLRIFEYPDEEYYKYLPYTKTRLFKNIKNAYEYAFYNIEYGDMYGKIYLNNDKLISKRSNEKEIYDNEDIEIYEEDIEIYEEECIKLPIDVENISEDILDDDWLKNEPYYNILSKEEIWGMNVVKKCSDEFNLEYTDYKTVLNKKKGYKKIVLWAVRQIYGSLSKVCFLTLEKVDNIIDNNIVEI